MTLGWCPLSMFYSSYIAKNTSTRRKNDTLESWHKRGGTHREARDLDFVSTRQILETAHPYRRHPVPGKHKGVTECSGMFFLSATSTALSARVSRVSGNHAGVPGSLLRLLTPTARTLAHPPTSRSENVLKCSGMFCLSEV